MTTHDAPADSGPVWVLIPVKEFARGKSRLVEVLDAGERTRFARRLFDHVIGAVSECKELGGTMVVTDSAAVAEVASANGAIAIDDTPSASLGGIIDAALDALAARGAARAIVLMSDLPQLEAADIRALLTEMRAHDVVIAPDLRDEGTNALTLSLRPESGELARPRMRTEFGGGPSFARHCERARAHGLSLHVHRSPRLALDVDVPSDLELLGRRAGPAGLPDRADRVDRADRDGAPRRAPDVALAPTRGITSGR